MGGGRVRWNKEIVPWRQLRWAVKFVQISYGLVYLFIYLLTYIRVFSLGFVANELLIAWTKT